MPSNTQIVPEHDYAHVKVVEYDNSSRPATTLSSTAATYCNMMFMFNSPKGIDRELQTISKGLSEFTETFGIGDFDTYGQAFLNAYNAASTNAATLHCLRVTADDATYSAGALVAHYKASMGGSTPGDPTVTPTDKLNVMHHANVVATDKVDPDGTVHIAVAGTDVTPGISAENTNALGDIVGDYIDVDLIINKVFPTLSDAKNYKVTQINPALAQYAGKDEYVSYVDGNYQKVKVYTGKVLKSGYALPIGSDMTAIVKIVEYGVPGAGTIIYITNTTDLGLVFADKKAVASVTKTGTNYTITCTGDAVAGVIHSDLWGAISGNFLETNVTFPITASKRYKVIQTNPSLAKYEGDPTISKVGNVWKKIKDYDGTSIADGYALLLGVGDADIKVYEADTFTTEEASTPVFTAVLKNGYQFVASHPTAPSQEIGAAVATNIKSTLAFVNTTSRSTLLRASAAARSVTRAITTPGTAATNASSMDIYYTFETSDKMVTDVSDLGNLVTVNGTPDAKGYTAVKVFEIACRGRGAWGDNIRFVLESYPRGDRMSNYKNYTMSIYEINSATLIKKEEFNVAFSRDAVNSEGATIFADYLVGDPYQNSNYISMVTNTMAFKEMFAAYQLAFPDTSMTAESFDPLTGMVKGTNQSKVPGLTIDTTSTGTISVSGASGIALLNGSDGALAITNPNRNAVLNTAYLKAYSGEIDRNVLSRKMYPTDIILDANFPPETKCAITELVAQRKDCVGILDLGTDFNTFAGMMENLADVEPYVVSRDMAIDAYYGKIQDPVSFKIVKVSSSYVLANMYPLHFQKTGDKHVPLAGSSYAVINGFLSGSAFPVFDDDLDTALLDTLASSQVNFLKVNTLKQVIRGAQTTRQDLDTNLSELNNVFILKDIRRDAIQLCEQYEYNFAEATDMQRFNKAASILADKYKESQVKSISAAFSMNDWESERGILHLYIDLVHKNIIKRSIVEIDINRGTVVA